MEQNCIYLYGLKACDTCRKAMRALNGAQLVDVRDDGLPDEILMRALQEFGSNLVNTRSTTWRGLSQDDRAGAPEALIRAYPALMKRPLILISDKLYLGWSAETQKALGVSQ